MLTGAQVTMFVMIDLAVIIMAARLFGAAAKKVGQPSVVGEIIAGVALGPSLLGLISIAPDTAITVGPMTMSFLCDVSIPAEANHTLSSCLFPDQARSILNNFGQLALLLFMFLVGLELDLNALMGKGKQLAMVAVGVVVVPLLVGLGIGPIMFTETFVADVDTVNRVGFGLFLGAFLSMTALPVMARILQEKKLNTTPLGIVGVAAAAAVTVLAFMLVSIAGGVANEAPTGLLVMRVVLTIAYLLFMLFVMKPLLAKRLGDPYGKRARDIGLQSAKMTWSGIDEFSPAGAGHALSHAMFAWIIVIALLSGWVSHMLGVTVIIGGFMAGLVMPAREGLVRDMTTELFDVVVILLLPIFLAFSGLNTDVTQLSGAAIPGLLIFIVAAIVAKWGSGAVLGKASGLSWQEANLLGILMNCRGLLPLVVGLVGLQSGVISPAMNVVAVIMALVTTAMTGPLFDRFNKKATPQPAAEPSVPA
jgi:Kef-type K+ transport system membrane component KefB